MKIGLVLASVPQYSETFFRSKIDGLTQAGHTVYIFTNNFYKGNEYRHVRLYKFHSNNLYLQFIDLFLAIYAIFRAPFKAIKFYNLCREDNNSILQSLNLLYIASAVLPYQLDWLHFGFITLALKRENIAKAIDAKMAVSIRGYDIAIYPLKHINCFKTLWSKVDKLHYISDDLLNIAQKEGLSYNTLTYKITPAIKVHKYQPSPTSYKINNPLKILTVGRLHWKKGYEYAFRSLLLLKKENIKFRYRIIGTGAEEERLKFAAYQLGLGDDVEFAGKMNQDDVINEYHNTDIYLQPSVQEGFCNSVLEAQSCGKLCIVSNAEGLSENVLNNETGWVVPKRNPEVLGLKIIEVVKMTESDRKKIVDSASERIKNEFTIEKQIKLFEEFYRL